MSKYLRKYEEYESPWEDDDEAYYHDDDYLFGRPNYSSKKQASNKYYDYKDDDDDDGYEYEEDSEEMEHLLYLLRMMFKNSGIEEVEVSSKGLDIEIDVYLNKEERLKSILKVFEVAKKLKKDILAQYDSEFNMYYTKEGDPVLTFNFDYGDGLDDDKSPFK